MNRLTIVSILMVLNFIPAFGDHEQGQKDLQREDFLRSFCYRYAPAKIEQVYRIPLGNQEWFIAYDLLYKEVHQYEYKFFDKQGKVVGPTGHYEKEIPPIRIKSFRLSDQLGTNFMLFEQVKMYLVVHAFDSCD